MYVCMCVCVCVFVCAMYRRRQRGAPRKWWASCVSCSTGDWYLTLNPKPEMVGKLRELLNGDWYTFSMHYSL